MKLPLLLLFWFLLCLAPARIEAQTAPVQVQDSVPDTPAPIQKKFLPVPKKSLMWAIIPGGGQVYNRRYWKVPIVYAAMGGIVYAIDFNQTRYRSLKTALELKLKGEPHEYSGTQIDNTLTLRTLRDGFDKNTQLSYIGMFLVYALQGVEAYTDAHLMDFDIGDDLSLQVQPRLDINPATQSLSPGLGLRLRFST
ncbi:MAG: DUF5683 domain-containing protein [Saprospiraceae bacterium]|nr:DUF5683 domain-containing protein [Saprospiraceae bacterium]